MKNAMQLIKIHEGTNIENGKHMPYRDTEGKWTIGYGRNLETHGISDDEVTMLMKNDKKSGISLGNETSKPVRGRHYIWKNRNGYLMIGFRNLSKNGISSSEAEAFLQNDVNEFLTELHSIFPDFSTYSDVRQGVLLNMIFNIGMTKFKGFTHMIDYVQKKNWTAAAQEMVKSFWYWKVINRARTLVNMMLTNQWPKEII